MFAFDKQKLLELWKTDLPNREIAAQLGLTEVQLYVAGRKLKLIQRWGYVRRVYRKYVDPTEDEIRARAAEIRAGWSEEEREKRLVGNCVDRTWRPPAFEFRQGIAFRSQ